MSRIEHKCVVALSRFIILFYLANVFLIFLYRCFLIRLNYEYRSFLDRGHLIAVPCFPSHFACL